MIQFGTGGWRALIGEEFTKENIQILITALSMKIKAEGKENIPIAAGYDRRFLSKEALIWACCAFAKQGIKVLMVNRSSPTPLIMHYVMANNLEYGIMVTASHNPAIFNGIKVFTKGGRDASEEITHDIESYIDEASRQYEWNDEEKNHMPPQSFLDYIDRGLIEYINPQNNYLDSIIDKIDMNAIRNSNLRIAIDPMFGVSLESLNTILSIARCSIETINSEHDTLFGGKMPAPTEKSLRRLQSYVIDRYCDIGIATDGDADRLGVIDDTGHYLHANDILLTLYYYLLKYKGMKGDVVRNIATTHRLDKVAESFGYKCHEVPVGFKHISNGMKETGAIIGGESSGGLTVVGHINGKDGIFAACLLIEMIAVTGKKLSQIAQELENLYGKYYMLECDKSFPADAKERIQNMLLVEKRLPQFPIDIEKISYLDGCKVYFKNGGWIIARFSGTEPLLRIFCEMQDKELAQNIVDIMKDFIASNL